MVVDWPDNRCRSSSSCLEAIATVYSLIWPALLNRHWQLFARFKLFWPLELAMKPEQFASSSAIVFSFLQIFFQPNFDPSIFL